MRKGLTGKDGNLYRMVGGQPFVAGLATVNVMKQSDTAVSRGIKRNAEPRKVLTCIGLEAAGPSLRNIPPTMSVVGRR